MKFPCDLTTVTIFSADSALRSAEVAVIQSSFDRLITEIEKDGKLSEVWPPPVARRPIECPLCKGLGVRYVANATRPNSHPHNQ